MKYTMQFFIYLQDITTLTNKLYEIVYDIIGIYIVPFQ